MKFSKLYKRSSNQTIAYDDTMLDLLSNHCKIMSSYNIKNRNFGFLGISITQKDLNKSIEL